MSLNSLIEDITKVNLCTWIKKVKRLFPFDIRIFLYPQRKFLYI